MSVPVAVTILVVDDQQPMRKTIAFILRQAGFKDLEFAESGEMAWEAITKSSIGLVLLDWNMPGLTGFALLERIRSHPSLAGLPVIMVTAEAHQDLVLSAIAAGVDDYVVKPFTPAVLLKKVRDVLVRRPFTRPAGLL